jgi:ATP-dependent Clp protease ATP-binding subunit ClpA
MPLPTPSAELGRASIIPIDRWHHFCFLARPALEKLKRQKLWAKFFRQRFSNHVRLDMSEYSSPDALSKLIGSFAAGKTGVLATILKEHPYGVLLLDEFEKTTPEVMNLFLQVLDEGFFSDMEGKKINARNLAYYCHIKCRQ